MSNKPVKEAASKRLLHFECLIVVWHPLSAFIAFLQAASTVPLGRRERDENGGPEGLDTRSI